MNVGEWKESVASLDEIRIGNRLLLDDVSNITKLDQKVRIKCSCGNIKRANLRHLLINTSKTCGECEFFKFKNSKRIVFNELMILDELKSLKNFSTIVNVRCSCGNETKASLRQVYYGRKKTCGQCAVTLKKKPCKRFGNLTLLTPLDQVKLLVQHVDVACDCGNKLKVIYRNLIIKNTTSCGSCALFKFKQQGKKKFGDLTLLTELDSISTLSQMAKFKCNCGTIIERKLFNVITGHTKRCGRCYRVVRNAHVAGLTELNNMSFPIKPGVLFGQIRFFNDILSSNTKLDAMCPICGNPWSPVFKDVRRGASLSCGCSYSKISTQQKDIRDFIKQYGFDIQLESKINGFWYDIWVPEQQLLIEFNGLKWHVSKKRIDIDKYRNAMNHGYHYMMIYEDEWRNKQEQIRNIIAYKLGRHVFVCLRPAQCSFILIDHKEADKFYERFHYIGGTRARINIAAVYQGKYVACVSFKSPNRKSNYQYELTRMASRTGYVVYGIWSKILRIFMDEFAPRSIVTFSDNRLFSGSVYKHMGFNLDGNVRPDYYWVKGRHRYNKSGLRKPSSVTVTEHVLRTSQGYAKIWDLGKKRWVYERNQIGNPCPSR
jgi:hypothetical protein